MVIKSINPATGLLFVQRSYIHTSRVLSKLKNSSKIPSSGASFVQRGAPPQKSNELSNLLLELSKSSSILHTGSDVKGYSRPLSSVVSKEVKDIFDDRKLFYGVFESATEREMKTIDLKKKVSEVIQPPATDHRVHKVDSITLFTSNDQVKKKSTAHTTKKRQSPVYVRKLNDHDSNNDLNVDLDSVLSFLNKNIR